MIAPDDITKYDRTDWELMEFWLFCCVVAGKNSKVQARKLDEFFYAVMNGGIEQALRKVKMGQYNRLVPIFEQTYGTPIEFFRIASPQYLSDKFKGVGPKTSRFFVLHSRENAQVAALDTHILSWLRDQGYDAPKATPSEPKYSELEKIFLTHAWKVEMSPAEFDLMIWKQYSHKVKKET